MTEMSKVEEVARALAQAELDDGDGLYDWYALTDSVADKYRARVRAAIEANRMSAMLDASLDAALKE